MSSDSARRFSRVKVTRQGFRRGQQGLPAPLGVSGPDRRPPLAPSSASQGRAGQLAQPGLHGEAGGPRSPWGQALLTFPRSRGLPKRFCPSCSEHAFLARAQSPHGAPRNHVSPSAGLSLSCASNNCLCCVCHPVPVGVTLSAEILSKLTQVPLPPPGKKPEFAAGSR